MLSAEEIREELRKVTYKPGWGFEVYEHPYEGVHVAVSVTVPNAYDPEDTVDLCIRSAIPPLRDYKGLHSWMLWRLGRIENHEMREFYKVDGACWSDPHKEEV